jgi:CRP/FNR family cyclic AMP-dependent transcriptional regulator
MRTLRRLLDIRAEEWPQFLLLFAIYTLYIVGTFWAKTILVAELSSDQLNSALLVSGLVAIGLSLVYIPVVDRIPKDRMLLIITLGSAAVVALLTLGLLVLGDSFAGLAYPALYVVFMAGLVFTWGTQWGTFALGLYDTRAAKRVWPLLLAGRPLGLLIIAALLRLGTGLSLAQVRDPVVVMGVWVVLLLVVAAMIALRPRLVDADPPDRTWRGDHRGRAAEATTSPLAAIAEGLGYVRASPLLRWMAVSSILFFAISALVLPQARDIFETYLASQYDDPALVSAALKSFIADLDAVAFLIMLVFQLFITNRLLKRIGLGNMNLIHPFTTLLTGALLLAALTGSVGLLLVAGVLAYVNREPLRRAFRDPPGALLYNAVPLHTKSRVRAVVIGLISPAGMVLATLLKSVLSDQLPIFALIVVLAAAYVGVAFILRREYARALVQMLQQGSYTYLLSQRTELGVTDSSTLKALADQFTDSDDPEFKLFLASIMMEIGGRDAVPIVQAALVGPAELRAGLLDVLIASDVRNDSTTAIYRDLLADPDPAVRVRAVDGLAMCLGADDPAYLAAIAPLLADPALPVQVAVLPPLLVADDPAYEAQAGQVLDALFESDDPARRLTGVQVLPRTGDDQTIHALIGFLEDADDAVRLAATEGIEQLWHDGVPEDIYPMLLDRADLWLHDPVEQVRLAELALLHHIHTLEARTALLGALVDESPRVQAAAVDTMADIGAPMIPLLEARLEQGPGAKMAAVALNRIDPGRYGALLMPLIEADVQRMYENHYRLAAFTACRDVFPSMTILGNTLHAENEHLAVEIFDLLGLLHPPDALAVIRESLRSGESRTRSNAVEALESLTSPRLAARIAPLFDPTTTAEALVQQHTGKTVIPQVLPILVALEQGDDDWLRAVTLFALGEIGALHPELPMVLAEGKADASPEAMTRRHVTPPPCVFKTDIRELLAVLQATRASQHRDVRSAARAAWRSLRGESVIEHARQEGSVLSVVERMILMKKVPLFQDVPLDQLKVLAGIGDERLFDSGTTIFKENDPGGTLFIVVDGRVAVGIEGDSPADFTQLATYEANTAFGDMTLFSAGPRTAAAIALEDTLTLCLESEPLKALLHRQPDLAIELVRQLTERLREANRRIADLSSAADSPPLVNDLR